MSEYGISVNGEELVCTPQDTAVMVFKRNHLLDHIMISEIDVGEELIVPRGKRLFRELFESNDIDFNEVVTELVSLAYPFIEYPNDIPDYFVQVYAEAVVQDIEKEWEYYSGEA